jgi:pyruvate/2-oxoglutarate dehydrogenase complex dihydrolipoamide dehydrogenase (E3) component
VAIDNVDVVVIGMGPGGEDAAARLAKAGLTVVGVEARLVGGECPYYACVPTKMMIRAAAALAEARRVGELAGSAQVRPDWAPVAARIRAEATDNWDDTVAVRRFEKAGGPFVRGRARITAPGQVTVATSTVSGLSTPPRQSCSIPAPNPPSRRSTVWPARRTGQTATPWRSSRCLTR